MATSANVKIFDGIMNHAMVVEMFNRRLNSEISKILSRSDRAVATLIRNGDLSALKELLPALETQIFHAYEEVSSLYNDDIRKFISNEVDFNQKLLKRNVGDALKLKKPSKLDIRKAVIGSRIRVGKTATPNFEGHMSGLAKAEFRQVRAGVRQALALGLTEKQAVDYIYKNPKFPAPNRLTRNQARALLRTSITDVQTYTSLETFRANGDIIQRFKYVATLDNRTSPICRSLDGNIFYVNDASALRPPQHYNCRSTIVPVVMGYEEIEGVLKKKGVPLGKRASIDGQVPATTNYQNWLFNQPYEQQLRVLGNIDIVDQFRKGRVTVNALVANTGRSLSVGAARRADNDIVDGQGARIIDNANDNVRTYDLEGTFTSSKEFRSKINRLPLLEFLRAQGKSNGAFGRGNLKNRIGPDLDIEGFDVPVKDDVISFSFEANRRAKDKAKRAFDNGAISRQDYEWLNDLNLFSYVESNQATYAYEALLRTLANLEGRTLVKNKAGNIVPYKGGTIQNINAYLVKELNLQARAIRGDLNDLPDSIALPIKQQYEGFSGRLDIERKFRRTTKTIANMPEIIEVIEELFDIPPTVSAARLSEVIVDTIADQLTQSGRLSINTLGRRILDVLDESYDLQRSHTLGSLALERFRGVLPYDYVNVSRLVKDRFISSRTGKLVYTGKYVKVQEVILIPTNKSWATFSEARLNNKRLKALPIRDRRFVESPKAGATTYKDGRPVISHNADIDTIEELTSYQAKVLTNKNNTGHQYNTSAAWGFRELSKLAPELFGKSNGGLFIKGRFTDDHRVFLETLDYLEGKTIYYRHTLDYRGGRINVLGRNTYNSHQWAKGIHDAPFERNFGGNKGFQDLVFESAEYVGPQTIRNRRVGIGSVEGRSDIVNYHLKDLEKWGEALVTQNATLLQEVLPFIKSVKKPGQAQRVAIEFYRIKLYTKNHTKSLDGYRSAYVGSQDATSSALQIAGITTKNERLIRKSNVTNKTNRKSTPYQEVGEDFLSHPTIQNDPILREISRDVAEDIGKNPLMTTLYKISRGRVSSVTRHEFTGIANQVRKEFEDIIAADPERFNSLGIVGGRLSRKQIYDMADAMTEVIDNNFPELRPITELASDFTESMARTSGSAQWTQALTGNPVRYRKLVINTKSIEYTLAGRKRKDLFDEVTDVTDVSETGRIGSPSIIHSIDAGVDQRVGLESGVWNRTNKDSFSTPIGPDRDKLNAAFKQAYIELYKEDWWRTNIYSAWRAGHLSNADYERLILRLDELEGNWDQIDLIPTHSGSYHKKHHHLTHRFGWS